MSTQPQIIANRLNAQKSTGPKTAQGKAIVSQNALKHGLSARHDVIITESQADFDLHRDSLLEELSPQGPTESILADRIISLSWRLKRADRIQNQTFDAMDEENKSNPLANLANSVGLKGLQTPQPSTASQPDLTLGRIALKDFANARVLDRMLMYERRIENSLHKTLQELQRLTLIRNLTPTDQPNPKDPHLAPAPVPGVITKQNNTSTPKTHPANHKSQPPSTLVERPLQIGLFAQNPARDPWRDKPNPQNPKIKATSFTTKSYTNIPPRSPQKNKPKQTQFPGEIRNTPPGPLQGQHEIRDTPYAIRNKSPRSSRNKFLAIAAGTSDNSICATRSNCALSEKYSI